MKDAIYMCKSDDGMIPLYFLEQSIELARLQAEEHGLDRVHIWIATNLDDKDVVSAVLWSTDDTPPPSSYEIGSQSYMGLFSVERSLEGQGLVSVSGEVA